MHGRIWFEGNPWPGGHAVAEASFAGAMTPRGVGLLLHLRTENYVAVPVPDEDDDEDAADWDAPGVWGNYGRCTLSNRFWGVDPDRLPLLARSPAALDATLRAGVMLHVDPPEADTGDPEDNGFAIYLLGHDSVRDHHIAIRPAAGDLFDIDWSGRIALTYGGESDYAHAFRAELRGLAFAGLLRG